MNGYDLLKKLGKGGMGTAFMVRRTLDNQIFALKQVRSPPSHRPHPPKPFPPLAYRSLTLSLSHFTRSLVLYVFVFLSLSLYVSPSLCLCVCVSVCALFSLFLSLPLLAHASFICFFPVILGL